MSGNPLEGYLQHNHSMAGAKRVTISSAFFIFFHLHMERTAIFQTTLVTQFSQEQI